MSLVYSAHYTEPLLSLANTQLPLAGLDSPTEQLCTQIDALLRPPFAPDAILHVLTLLRNNAREQSELVLQAILAKIAVGLYANALDLYLNEASTAQEDAEWWTEVEQSDQLAALYLLQTLPKRILNLLRVLRASDGSLHLSTFRPASLRALFLNQSQLQPNAFASIFFPHLKSNPLTRVHPVFYVDVQASASTILSALHNTARRLVNGAAFALYFPLRLSRDECRLKREANEKIRNDKAEVLGKLVGMRPALMQALTIKHGDSSVDGAPIAHFFIDFVAALSSATSIHLPEQNALANFEGLSEAILVTRKEEHASFLEDNDLRQPSRLTLLWPRLLLLPPVTLYCVKTLYASRATLTDLAKDTLETTHNFITDWLLEPLREVMRTIRAGGEEGVIVRPEAVSADLNSLERMALALAQDKLGYTQTQLAALSDKIRMGDLTPILEIYEADIKQPFKSAISGTLLRSLFVQVQKAKVDIDQALTGIDKLLKSQELTFAFVGVAPALAVVYVVGGFLKRVFFGGGKGYGGKHRQTSVWFAMRRIERLLLFQPKALHRHADQLRDIDPSTNSIPPLTTGLLVLSLTHLRHYALTSLPARSRLREGFLEDVRDIEDPNLGRWEKMRVLDRIWSSWGRELGWYNVAVVLAGTQSYMKSYGHTYLTSYGWTGNGTGLRHGAIAKPLAIPPKKNLSGLGKDRDEAFPFWDHLFTAASKAITIRVSSEDEDDSDAKDPSSCTDLLRTTTGIISNRRPVSGTAASTSGSTTPNLNPIVASVPYSRPSLLATAKREAAKSGLYARFFRGPVLGPDGDVREDNTSDATSPSASTSRCLTPVHEPPHKPDRVIGGTTGRKRKSDDDTETKEVRGERKRLKKERKATRAVKRTERALEKDKAAEENNRLGVVYRKDDEATSSLKRPHKRARRSLLGEKPEGEITAINDEQQDASSRPPSHVDATDALNIVFATKKKGKRKDTPH